MRIKGPFIYAGLSLFLICILLSTSFYWNRKIDSDIVYHGKVLAPYVWELDFDGVYKYLTLAANSYSYSRVQFYDSGTEQMQADILGPQADKVDSFFISLKLLRSTQKHVDIFYEGQIIGSLNVFSYNRYVYWQLYIVLLFILIYFISYLFMNLSRARKFLEQRVRVRTAELEDEINNRMKTEEKLKLTLDSIGDGVISTDREGRIDRMNPVAQELIGISMKEAFGHDLGEILHIKEESSDLDMKDTFQEIIETGGLSLRKGTYRTLVSRTGEEYSIIESGTPIRSREGDNIGIVLVFRDMTGELRLQKQLEHSQRMDAVGHLAGGIAHDFNNMLGGIMGASELLGSYIKDNEKAGRMNKIIHEATERAAELTNQLLTFSRKKTMSGSNLDLHKVISDTASLLERTIDKRIKIYLDLKAAQSLINGDYSMLQNALINLGINASHAIAGEGLLSCITENVYFDEDHCRLSAFELDPGQYIQLIVEDNGKGMPENVKNHIFEPFFTTRTQEKGTGLGLSTVYGTITQHRGEIKVYSEEGQGTAFHLFFPLSSGNVDTEVTDIGEIPKGSGTILVVDDVEAMRITAGEFLKEAGYDILTAEDGIEALQVFSRESDRIDLVILDMIMPRMNGKECFLELQKISPQVPIILSSGFKNAEDYQFLKTEGLDGSINKPYRKAELIKLVYQILKDNNHQV